MIIMTPARRRNPVSLTPMIDVVFLLLIFFILSARFGAEQTIDLALGGAAGTDGPPRIVDIGESDLRLNGVATGLEDLSSALAQLGLRPSDVIVLRAGEGADLQRVLVVIDALRASGFEALALVER